MRRCWRLLYVAAPLFTWGCGVDLAEGAASAASAAAEFPSLSSTARVGLAAPRTSAAGVWGSDTAAYEGSSYALRYPGDASILVLDSIAPRGTVRSIQIRGPELRDDQGDPISGSASYVLEVAEYEDSTGLGLDRWVERYGDREHDYGAEQAGHDPGAGATTRATVAGVPALQQRLWGGDCDLVRYYIARGRRVVVFRYEDYPVANDPHNLVNLRTYASILGTFRWNTP